MTPPREALARYLDSEFPGATVEPLTGDASARRFFRVRLPGGTTHQEEYCSMCGEGFCAMRLSKGLKEETKKCPSGKQA